MTGSLLMRGMLAGLLAAFLAFGFARVYAEPEIEQAIAFEESGAPSHHEAAAGSALESHHPEGGHDHGGEEGPVSRQTQAGLGLLTGLSVIGAAAGGLFSIVFALSRGRVGSLDPKRLSLGLAAVAYVVVVLVPGLKYPANPPAVGSPETLEFRTILFFAMVAISLLAVALALQTARVASAAAGSWNGALIGLASFVAVIAVAYWVLPAVNELPEGFSADVLWRFRLGSFGTQAVLWGGIGLFFGFAADRLLNARPRTTALTAAP